jgi:hypothetical protein
VTIFFLVILNIYSNGADGFLHFNKVCFKE